MIEKINWDEVSNALNEKGFAHLSDILSKDECLQLQTLYGKEDLFRSVINMQRYRFGKGEYKYFSYPLPKILQTIREKFYEKLVPIANDWMTKLGIPINYPFRHKDFIEECHSKKQLRPTPLI